MLIVLLLAALIVGVLAAVAVPLYLGSAKSPVTPGSTAPNPPVAMAMSTEARMVAGTLWSVLQANAMATCGTSVTVSGAYAKAGLTNTGATTPPRWAVTSGDATLVSDCGTGVLAAGRPTLFMVAGTAADVNLIRIQFQYDATRTPPSWLQCSVDGGATFIDC